MRVFLDPWESEYTSFFQVEEEPKVENIRLDVEIPENDWHPIEYRNTNPLKDLIFVDGVRRMHQRVVMVDENRVFYGGFGTYVAGALRIVREKINEISSSLIEISVKRVFIIPEEVKVYSRKIRITKIPFPVEIKYINKNEPNAPLQKLQDLMRAEEVKLVDRIISTFQYQNVPIVVDGTLHFPWKSVNVVGFVKSLHNLYLPERLLSFLRKLNKKQRTPIFEITFQGKELTRKYSWFVRLGALKEGEFPYAKVARLEAPGGVEKEVFSIANWSITLADFISNRMRDKRSPQNLLPVGVLERELKKRIGNEYIISQRLRVLLRKEIL